jgi:hypothetical protein
MLQWNWNGLLKEFFRTKPEGRRKRSESRWEDGMDRHRKIQKNILRKALPQEEPFCLFLHMIMMMRKVTNRGTQMHRFAL